MFSLLIRNNLEGKLLTKSQIAERNGIDNTPNEEQLCNLKILVIGFLQPLRDHFGLPIRITSAFRHFSVDKILVPNRNWEENPSQHSKGEAADFEITGIDNYTLACYIKDNMDFDQLILEYYEEGKPDSGWIHCSYKATGNRKEILRARRNTKGETVYSYSLD